MPMSTNLRKSMKLDNQLKTDEDWRRITNSMADGKWSEQMEDHLESKTKSCQPRRKFSEVQRTFQKSAHKPSRNHLETFATN